MIEKIIELLTSWKDRNKGDKGHCQLSMRRIVFRNESVEDTLPSGYEYAEYVAGFDNNWVQLINENQDFRNLGIWTKETLYRIMITHIIPGGCILIIRRGELIACTCLCRFSHNTDTVILMYLLVDHNHRGQGLGNAMIQHAIRICQDNGIKEIRLSTDDYRLAAIKLYLSNGFHFTSPKGMKSEEQLRKVIEQLK